MENLYVTAWAHACLKEKILFLSCSGWQSGVAERAGAHCDQQSKLEPPGSYTLNWIDLCFFNIDAHAPLAEAVGSVARGEHTIQKDADYDDWQLPEKEWAAIVAAADGVAPGQWD